MKNLARQPKFGKGLSPVMTDQLWLLAVLAAGAFIFAMVTVFSVSLFAEIQVSAWGIVGSAAPWYVAVIAGWIIFVQLPLFVAHGRTRKAAFREWLITGLGMVPLAAILMGVGFLFERGIYNLAGFSTDAEHDQFFAGTSDFLTIVLQYALTFAVWYALGGFVGGCLYRSPDWGWISIPVAIGIASVSGAWNHTGGGLFAITRRIVPGINYESTWLDLGLSGLAVGVGVWFAWLVVSEISLRNP